MNKDIKQMIYFLNHSKRLTRQQIALRDELMARDLSKLLADGDDSHSDGEELAGKKKNGKKEHHPKKTTDFLSLFNNPDGLKFLTHDFDPNREITYTEVLEKARNQFEKAKRLPSTLWSLMDAVLNGKDGNKANSWFDYSGKHHNMRFATQEWQEWSVVNANMHPVNNPAFADTISAFRNTIRIVKPALMNFADELSQKYKYLEIERKGLEKADFYTHVGRIRNGINRIFADIESHSNDVSKVLMEFSREHGDEYSMCIVKITHLNSEASDLDDVIKKYNAGGGAFSEISKTFCGYCNWSVEALWNGNPKRWNILDDTGKEEIESIDRPSGFTHILSFYKK